MPGTGEIPFRLGPNKTEYRVSLISTPEMAGRRSPRVSMRFVKRIFRHARTVLRGGKIVGHGTVDNHRSDVFEQFSCLERLGKRFAKIVSLITVRRVRIITGHRNTRRVAPRRRYRLVGQLIFSPRLFRGQLKNRTLAICK